MDESQYHFTYREGAGDLAQGDLLAKTPEVVGLLEKVHPHYLKDDYTHLLVVTQSCDLVRRKGQPCKARYVSLAAVRPLSLVIERAIGKHQDEFASNAGVCTMRVKSLLEQFVERLLNNNEEEHFYLERDRALGLDEPACAFLRLSIAVRAADHYEKLLGARLLALTDVFQAKLGWLMGKMYSRVGTPDWAPDHANESEFKDKIRDCLGEAVRWVDDEQLKAAKRTLPAGTVTRSDLRKHIDNTNAPKRKDRVLDAVMGVVEGQQDLSPDAAKRLRQILSNDPALGALLKS